MPGTIKMNINTLNYSVNQLKTALSQKANPVPTVNPPSSLNGSMIGRIFKVKPGCGSCGK